MRGSQTCLLTFCLQEAICAKTTVKVLQGQPSLCLSSVQWSAVCILTSSLMPKLLNGAQVTKNANQCSARHDLSNKTSLMFQVLTDNSDTPFEHVQPENGVDDAVVPVHPFQQRIAQLDTTPPSLLARCPSHATPSHLSACTQVACVAVAPLSPTVILAMNDWSEF